MQSTKIASPLIIQKILKVDIRINIFYTDLLLAVFIFYKKIDNVFMNKNEYRKNKKGQFI
jgi:hypothetical protein